MQSAMKSLPSTAILVAALICLPLARGCNKDEDCDLNGMCTNNVRICDAGWTGTDCGQLDLRPGPRANGYNRTEEGISSWCNGIIHDPISSEIFHLFISEFTHGCGLDYWSPYSRIIRAESSEGPLGPYTFKQEIVPSFAHNPTVFWSEDDQKYLLYNIGCQQQVPSICKNINFTCGPGNTLNGESGISVWSSSNLHDWTSHGQVFRGTDDSAWDADVTNPGPLNLRSSEKTPSTILSYRGCGFNCSGTELISIATAPDFAGPYIQVNRRTPIFTEASEDPFFWVDKRGNYHLLVHSLLPDAGFGDGPNVGRHAYARSWDGPWTFNKNTVAFNTTAYFNDGSHVDYYRRERPNIFFSDDGEMIPLSLSTGVQEMNSSASYSLIQPIGRTKFNEED
ncbi:hypothetical protein N7462_002006 [Penicillium macrosclerotiorum]|uniref:uncharacterized protein n=1 Tax=Penicillium macrosclerotiorum TaxID=303699 RepID=UPI002548D608|nr:uncharacterized protein N7462_002006 [Penicillium macrosclerotiorum]KAJ5692583.1 hypothetical protein N7462_002006 [Penicillium macrosclerotiorum]